MLLDVLSYGFMQKALIAGISVAIICSFMGTFLVLRRYALFGDGIAHVAFGGISVGFFLEWPIERPGCVFHPDALRIPLQALRTLHGNTGRLLRCCREAAAWSRESQAKNEG